MVVILLKQDDRFILKIHTSPSFSGKSDRVNLRPVIKLNNLIIRANAAGKKQHNSLQVHVQERFPIVLFFFLPFRQEGIHVDQHDLHKHVRLGLLLHGRKKAVSFSVHRFNF